MEIYLVDYDKNFSEYIEKWINDNDYKYPNTDAMEEDMPQVYNQWLETSASWLGNKSPNEYFNQFDDPNMLVETVLRYMSAKIGVPESLIDRIEELGNDALDAIKAVFNLEVPIPRGTNIGQARTLCVNILAEMNDMSLYEDYVRLLSEDSLDSSLAGVIIEKLSIEGKYINLMLEYLESTDNIIVVGRYIDILVNFEGDERILKWLLIMFNKDDANIALMASYLGKYRDEKALPYLREALQYEDINYLDYLEVRNAIEELGEFVDIERDFTGDSYYESLKNM